MVGYAFATRKNYTKLLKWSTRFACWLIKQYTVFVYFSFFQNQNEQWTHWLLHTYICTELSWLNIYLKTKYITIAIITIFVFKTNFLEVYICGLTIKWILWVSRDLWNFENKQKQKYFPKSKRTVRTVIKVIQEGLWKSEAKGPVFCRFKGMDCTKVFAVPKGSFSRTSNCPKGSVIQRDRFWRISKEVPSVISRKKCQDQRIYESQRRVQCSLWSDFT